MPISNRTVWSGAAAIGLVLGLAACNPPQHKSRARIFGFEKRPMKVADRLDCPEHEGRLTRLSQAADGRSCDYAGPGDEQVTLSLLQIGGQGPQAALQPLEAQLKSEAPAAAATASGPPARIAAESGNGHDHAKIDLPGFHIDADGDKAKIQLPGVSINAAGDDAQIHTSLGGVKNAVINAHHGGAEIRAGTVDANGADLVYVLASDEAGPQGYKAVGYIARGPASGPLVVATFKAKHGGEGYRNGDRGDLGRLVDLNVKG